MLKKTVMGLALVAAVALLVPQDAFARDGGGRGGGGFHGGGGLHGGGFRGGGGGGSRGFAVGPRSFGGGARAHSGGARFHGGGSRGYVNVARGHGGQWNNAHRGSNGHYRGHYRGYGRYPYYAAGAVGLGIAAGSYYYGGYPYSYYGGAPYDECYQYVNVNTVYGPQLQRVYVCE